MGPAVEGRGYAVSFLPLSHETKHKVAFSNNIDLVNLDYL